MKNNLAFSLIAGLLTVSALTSLPSCTTDKCSTISCQNNGTCEDGNCECVAGYEGSECQTRVNAKFAGAYLGSDDCYNVTGVGIEALNVGAQYISLSYEFDNLDENSIEVEGSVEGNKITITSKTVLINGVEETYSATGTLNGNTLTLNATITEDGTPYSCTFTGNK